MKIILGICSFILALQIYCYTNLMVSEKYELDETVIKYSDLSEEGKELEYIRVKEKGREIELHKKIIKYSVVINLIIILSIAWNSYNRKI